MVGRVRPILIINHEIVSIGSSSDMLDLDSTVLAHVLSLLNQRYEYGLDLYLLSIDEGITGYRDDSLEVSPFSFSSIPPPAPLFSDFIYCMLICPG